jgi:hypothetical protein
MFVMFNFLLERKQREIETERAEWGIPSFLSIASNFGVNGMSGQLQIMYIWSPWSIVPLVGFSPNTLTFY